MTPATYTCFPVSSFLPSPFSSFPSSPSNAPQALLNWDTSHTTKSIWYRSFMIAVVGYCPPLLRKVFACLKSKSGRFFDVPTFFWLQFLLSSNLLPSSPSCITSASPLEYSWNARNLSTSPVFHPIHHCERCSYRSGMLIDFHNIVLGFSHPFHSLSA